MKPTIALLTFLFFLQMTSIQGQVLKRNTFYLEAGGASFFYSVNYDRLFTLNERNAIATRIGFMYVNTFNDVARRMFGVPVGISYLRKLRKNFLEFGITGAGILDRYYSGTPFRDPTIEERVYIPSLKLGIRHVPHSKHFFWNAAIQYSMIFLSDRRSRISHSHSLPLPSLGVGYSF